MGSDPIATARVRPFRCFEGSQWWMGRMLLRQKVAGF
jgi:hypothetical protein